jgi:hypothetical protein
MKEIRLMVLASMCSRNGKATAEDFSLKLLGIFSGKTEALLQGQEAIWKPHNLAITATAPITKHWENDDNHMINHFHSNIPEM